MTLVLRALAMFVLAMLLWPECARYRAEWMLRQANERLDRVLRGVDRGAVGLRIVDEAAALARRSAVWLPADPRPPLLEGIALILRGDGGAAIAVLDAAIKAGERPELTLNLGRARSIVGDEAGANAAYLRSAWASPAAIDTLPKTMRASFLQQVSQLESKLRDGRLEAPPPLR